MLLILFMYLFIYLKCYEMKYIKKENEMSKFQVLQICVNDSCSGNINTVQRELCNSDLYSPHTSQRMLAVFISDSVSLKPSN